MIAAHNQPTRPRQVMAGEARFEQNDTPDTETKGAPANDDADVAPGKDTAPESEAAAKPPEDEARQKSDQAKDSDEEEGAPSSLTPPGTWSAEERAEFGRACT